MNKEQLELIINYIRFYGTVTLMYVIMGTTEPDLMGFVFVSALGILAAISMVQIWRSKE